MFRYGVGILAGTDTSNPFCFPGFSLHDELELMIEAGLPPMVALQTATFNAAEYSGMLQDFGSVAEGKVADLILLSANPLSDIRNTTKIHAVILNGVLHNRRALDAMLRQVKKAAKDGQ
jgi:imidazolonepropionase-like amidohydrolase